MTSGYDMTEDATALLRRLQVELAAAYAALKSLLGAIPECSCIPAYKLRGLVAPDCIRCDLEHEIGIAQNLLGEE